MFDLKFVRIAKSDGKGIKALTSLTSLRHIITLEGVQKLSVHSPSVTFPSLLLLAEADKRLQ